MRTPNRHDLLRRRPFGICRQAKWGMTSEAKSSRVSPSFRSPLISRSMPAPRYCRIRSICWMPDRQTTFVAANGLRFEVLEQGTGVRLALGLHGFPEHAISWRHQIPAPEISCIVAVADERGRPTAATPAKNPRHRARRETTLQREIAVKNVSLGIFDPARCRRNPDFLGGFPPKSRSVLRNRQGVPRLSRVSSRAREGKTRGMGRAAHVVPLLTDAGIP